MTKHMWVPKFEAIGADKESHRNAWQEGMDWARIEVDYGQLRDEFVKWAETNLPEHVNHIKTLPQWHFMTIGRVALLINRGAVPMEETLVFFKKKVDELISIAPVVEESDTEDDLPVTAHARRVSEYVNLYSFIDAIVTKYMDDGEQIEEKIKHRLRVVDPTRVLLKKLYVHYKENMADCLAEKDNPLVEKRIAPMILVVNILAAASGNATVAGYKSTKVDRKAVKAAEKVTYKVMDVDTNMASVNPAQLVGTAVAVVYDT